MQSNKLNFRMFMTISDVKLKLYDSIEYPILNARGITIIKY
ncbi:hypothetical protein Phpb_04105 [Photorhabdus namnaonensis]|uniref:Uncharacterized protein n=1 Tax=Photorhabdus namnaonensis TaxID=1851568 RepID=A0A1B8YD34_9GAMM|nr:hypothetical protein Phpb_04105 [Photorhabdus namnaonensis]